MEGGSSWRVAVLVILGYLALLVVALGIDVAIYANSPANRTGNALADIGVLCGVIIAIGAGIVTLAFWVAAVVAYDRDRERFEEREWWRQQFPSRRPFLRTSSLRCPALGLELWRHRRDA
jgi:hypothetical protein